MNEEGQGGCIKERKMTEYETKSYYRILSHHMGWQVTICFINWSLHPEVSSQYRGNLRSTLKYNNEKETSIGLHHETNTSRA